MVDKSQFLTTLQFFRLEALLAAVRHSHREDTAEDIVETAELYLKFLTALN